MAQEKADDKWSVDNFPVSENQFLQNLVVVLNNDVDNLVRNLDEIRRVVARAHPRSGMYTREITNMDKRDFRFMMTIMTAIKQNAYAHAAYMRLLDLPKEQAESVIEMVAGTTASQIHLEVKKIPYEEGPME